MFVSVPVRNSESAHYIFVYSACYEFVNRKKQGSGFTGKILANVPFLANFNEWPIFGFSPLINFHEWAIFGFFALINFREFLIFAKV